MEKPYILAEQLSYSIEHNLVINQVDFCIERGACIALVGANGCGKSTLLKLMCGLIKPTAGTLSLSGLAHQNATQSLILRNMIGYAPDGLAIYPSDSVNTYLKFVAELHKLPKDFIDTRVEEVITQFDLATYRNSRLASLSKGTQQRVNLAQAVLHQPQILLLDEPNTALDPEHTENLCAYIKQLRQARITIILASHDYNEIIPLCDYMFRISAGKLYQTVTPLNTREITKKHDQYNYTT